MKLVVQESNVDKDANVKKLFTFTYLSLSATITFNTGGSTLIFDEKYEGCEI